MEMNIFVILTHLFSASLAIPLVAQRLLSASNSNEVLLGLVNTNVPQGGAMNLLVPGVYQSQLQQKMAGLPQGSFGVRTGLTAQLPNQTPFQSVLTPNMGTQSILRDPTLQKQQQLNQIMSYVVAYGMPPKQDQTFGCLVPQLNGEVIMPSSGLQIPTKNVDDPLYFKENPTPVPPNQEEKAAMDVLKAP